MTKEEKSALKKKYKRKGTKKAREAERWERMLQHTNGGLASPQKEAK